VEAAERAATDPAVRRRAHTLAAYVASARFRLDMMDGVRAPFLEEAQRLFALRPTIRPLTDYDPILQRLDALLPGHGDLAARVEAFKAHYTVPRARIQAVVAAAIAECRRRTLAHIALPQNERFDLELVTGQSWAAYNWYHGDAHSLIQINTDLPYRIGGAVIDGCHEGYPGHHVQGIYAERLYRERGWVEFSIAPLFSPQGPINEGGGDYGIELAFPGAERLAFERDTLYPLAGLDPARAAAYDAFRAASKVLDGAGITIAQMYLDAQINRARAIDLQQHYGLSTRAEAEQLIAFTDHYRTYVINYVSGDEIVRGYANRAGPDNDAHWRAYLSILSQPTLPSDLQ
jgi:hypothetical protein